MGARSGGRLGWPAETSGAAAVFPVNLGRTDSCGRAWAGARHLFTFSVSGGCCCIALVWIGGLLWRNKRPCCFSSAISPSLSWKPDSQETETIKTEVNRMVPQTYQPPHSVQTTEGKTITRKHNPVSTNASPAPIPQWFHPRPVCFLFSAWHSLVLTLHSFYSQLVVGHQVQQEVSQL